MRARHQSLRSPLGALLSGLAVAAVLLLAASPGFTDDRDLLRFTSARPYLFFVLDTSASMNLPFGSASTTPLPGGGDNPDSRIYAAKQVLFNLMSTVDDVYFGFATFDQNSLHVVEKHYLYYNDGATALPAGWPLGTFPKPDPDGLTKYVDMLNLTTPSNGNPTDGVADTVQADVQGDVLTIGPLFDFSPLANGIPHSTPAATQQTPPGNTCSSPLPIGNFNDLNRLKLDSFALLNTDADLRVMTLWVSNGGSTYQLKVSKPATRPAPYNDANVAIGADKLAVTFEVTKLASTAGCTLVSPLVTGTNYWSYTPVLRQDARMNQTVYVDGPQSSPDAGEPTPGFWSWSDALASSSCNSSHPFSGQGWEGNYDSADTPPATQPLPSPYPTNNDRFCTNPADSSTCVELKPMLHTTYSTQYGRPLDKGDVLPFDWGNKNKAEMLRRLAPNYQVESPPDFSVAHYLTGPNANSIYQPRQSAFQPLIAAGITPLGKAVLDFRCWYQGKNAPNGKCRGASTEGDGWESTACSWDPNFGCRRPYLIFISDGDDNCPGENPAADTAGMNSGSGVQTWAINVGDPSNCNSGSVLHSMTQNGKGECVTVASPQKLQETIQAILGKIREEARTFASAAVPSVQAVADQALYLTDFTPLNGYSRWPGHLNGFLKPLPLTADGRPDTSVTCPRTDPSKPPLGDVECFVWDAARVLLNQTQRWVLYGRQSQPGLWPPGRQPLADLSACPDNDPSSTCNQTNYDLYRGFGLISNDTATASLSAATETAVRTEANTIIDRTLAAITRSGDPPCDATKELCTYKLGDIFHSDPLVFGQPNNTSFLVSSPRDQAHPDHCTATDETNGAGGDVPNFDRSYGCFLARHKTRRQVVFVGSNDGMLHAFNAAEYHDMTGRYDTGTGHELFAYMPRGVMPSVRANAESTQQHWGVDGPVKASDVFIDPVGNGATFPNPAERRWRTVLVGGYREGGSGYYALDVTQPDYLTAGTTSEFVPDESVSDPSGNHLPSCLYNWRESNCGPVPYGSPLWEFNDTTDNQIFATPALQPSLGYTMDEDFNGLPDLGASWSQVEFARVRVCEGTHCTLPNDGADVKAKYVVFFGGGMDADNKTFDPRTAAATDPDGAGPSPAVYSVRGDWLYMVDVETGDVLYKRELCSPYRSNAGNASDPCVPGGAAAAAPAAVDIDQDGFVDRVYIGTLGGYMYRVDLNQINTVSGAKQLVVPKLATMTLNAIDNNGSSTAVSVRRIQTTDDSGTTPLWNPYVIFDANWDGTSPSRIPRPIYFRPSVIVNQTVSGYALAFGTGDREDLWNALGNAAQDGRFYLFLDESKDPNAVASVGVSGPNSGYGGCASLAANMICPRTENDFARVDLSTATQGTAVDLLSNNLRSGIGRRGWFLALPSNERTITDAFSFSGVTFFATYAPVVGLVDPDTGDPVTQNGGKNGCVYKLDPNSPGCGKSGVSSLYLVSTLNGDGLLLDAVGNRTRSMQVSSFVTNPFTEFTTGSTGDTSGTSGNNADTLDTTQQAVMDVIKALYPSNCRFTTARIDIRTISADTKLQRLAAIPICMVNHSWKEF